MKGIMSVGGPTDLKKVRYVVRPNATVVSILILVFQSSPNHQSARYVYCFLLVVLQRDTIVGQAAPE